MKWEKGTFDITRYARAYDCFSHSFKIFLEREMIIGLKKKNFHTSLSWTFIDILRKKDAHTHDLPHSSLS